MSEADYDNPWKESLGDYFDSFLLFFFPQVHAVVDWTKPQQSLDKELQEIAPNSEAGLRVADKLFKVWRSNGEETWILIHIEVQSQEQSNFTERMYIYNYRVFDLYRRPVVSLAVLGDERVNWRPDCYSYAIAGCEVSLKFPIAKLLDYQSQWEIEQSNNPFALIVLAHLKTKATTGKPTEREQWKWNLVRELFERGYDRNEIRQLFRLIDRMMTLPEELQRGFEERLVRYQEERQMPLLSWIEIRAVAQNTRESVIDILEVRFNEIPTEVREKLNTISDVAVLKQLHRRAIAINSLPDFQQVLEEING